MGRPCTMNCLAAWFTVGCTVWPFIFIAVFVPISAFYGKVTIIEALDGIGFDDSNET